MTHATILAADIFSSTKIFISFPNFYLVSPKSELIMTSAVEGMVGYLRKSYP
jgi:hypothetical protein